MTRRLDRDAGAGNRYSRSLPLIDVRQGHGRNRVHQLRPHPIFTGVADNSHFYFVNSYYPVPSDPTVIIATANHGVTFCAAVARDNLVATQFHLEKSGETGLKVLDNFCKL